MRLKIKWVGGWAHLHGTAPNGERIRRTLKTQDPRVAEQLRIDAERQLWREEIYGPDAVVTFEQAALAYAEDGGDARFLIKVSEALVGRRLADIDGPMLRAEARRAYPDASNATLNRQFLTPACAVINWAHAEKRWCSYLKVTRFPVQRPKRVAVERDYLETLRPHLPHRLYLMMLFLHQTGRRVSDAVELTPDRLNGTAVLIDRTKNGEPAWARITPELAASLAELDPRHGRVFGYVHRSSLYPTLRRACAAAKVPYLGTHQPGRHSFATTLRKAGLSSRETAEAGGWKTTRMVDDIYDHPAQVHDRAAEVFAALEPAEARKLRVVPGGKREE